MAARPRPLHNLTPAESRAWARVGVFLMLRSLGAVVVMLGLVIIAAQHAGVPVYFVLSVLLVAQALWLRRRLNKG
jgi:ABC-type xylose transport system permease subunit